MQQSKDYGKFKQIDGNRKINRGHVARLIEAIERKNLLEYFPILLNEDMEVIDGQHRLSAAATLKIPFYYQVVPGLTLTDVMAINTNSKSWNIIDFIDSHIELGNNNYVILKEFMNTYHWNPTTSAALLQGFSGYFSPNNGSISKAIKHGDFKVISLDLAEKIAKQIQEIKHHTDFDGAKDREFIGALLALNANKDWHFDNFAAKLRLKNLMIEKRPSTKYYLIHLEELYNHGLYKTDTELYKSTQEVTKTKFK